MELLLLTSHPKANALTEWELPLLKAMLEKNPYRAEEVECVLSLRSALGTTMKLAGFYYEAYVLEENGCIKDKSCSAPTFRFRATLPESGRWTYTLTVAIDGAVVETDEGMLDVAPAEKPSARLQFEPVRRQNFADQNGNPVIFYGQNISSVNGILACDFAKAVGEAIREVAKYNGNYLYVKDDMFSCGRLKAKVNAMRQDVSAMWDYLFKTAEEAGVYLHFALFCENEFRSLFPKTIWHKNYGGFLENAEDFHTDEDTKAAVQNYLRYVTARWGYSEHLLAWELVQNADFNQSVVKGNLKLVQEWLEEMVTYLREVDAHKHLCSLTVLFPSTIPALYRGFDFVGYPQKNYYGVGNIAEMLKHVQRAYGCPTIMVESGLGSATDVCVGTKFPEDLSTFHMQNWSGVMGGGAGTAMNGEWREAMALNAMRDFKPLMDFAREIPWADPSLKMINVNAITAKNGRIAVQGYRGNTSAHFWFYDLLYLPLDRTMGITFQNETVSFAMPNGTYRARFVDTGTGETVQDTTVSVTNKTLSLTMPTWSKDIALAVTAE